MNKKWKWLLTALALVAVLVIAALLYRHLSERYSPKIPSGTTGVTTEAEPQTAAPSEEGETAVKPSMPKETTAEPAPPEKLAADFVVYDQNNAAVRLSDRFGKPLVVNFWASWCGPCCFELPAFDAAAAKYADEIDFMMVNLTDGFNETVDSVKQFVSENGYTFPVYFDVDQDADRTYSVYSIPMTVFIRADGTVLDKHIGAMDANALEYYLELLIG